jgi:transcriptional regulator GlxA family with amidase domain
MNTKLNHIENWPELALESKWSALTLAKNFGVSVRTLERHFLKQIGRTPKAWFIEQRQIQAAGLLREGLSVKEAAGVLHYKHPSHLSNDFTKHSGCCPSNRPTSETSNNP